MMGLVTQLRTTAGMLAAVGCLAAAGCGGPHDDASAEATVLTVFAAASLIDPFTEIGEHFEAGHDGVVVEFAFAGSTDLVAQLKHGAPADVIATADEDTMAEIAADELINGDAVPFATNMLRIATPPDNPAGVESLDDLARADVTTVVCAPVVPCGSATRSVEDAAGIEIAAASEESSVTDVLTKVTSGEADAGLVYVTDVARADAAVHGIAFPEAATAVNTYPIAAVRGSDHPDLAAQFVAYVSGEQGSEVLADAGFGRP